MKKRNNTNGFLQTRCGYKIVPDEQVLQKQHFTMDELFHYKLAKYDVDTFLDMFCYYMLIICIFMSKPVMSQCDQIG